MKRAFDVERCTLFFLGLGMPYLFNGINGLLVTFLGIQHNWLNDLLFGIGMVTVSLVLGGIRRK